MIGPAALRALAERLEAPYNGPSDDDPALVFAEALRRILDTAAGSENETDAIEYAVLATAERADR